MKSPLVSLLAFHTPPCSPAPTSSSSTSSSSSSFQDLDSNSSNHSHSSSYTKNNKNNNDDDNIGRNNTHNNSSGSGSNRGRSYRICQEDDIIHDNENKEQQEERQPRKMLELVLKLSKKYIGKVSLGTSVTVLIIMVYSYWRKHVKRRLTTKPSSITATTAITTSSNITSTWSTLRNLFISLFLLGESSNKTMKKKKSNVIWKEVSISQLLDAARNGHITKALLNASTCIFHLSSSEDELYKVKLPFSTSTFQAELVTLLSNGGCKDIGALPESWLTTISTPAIMVTPFIYLVVLYQMMKRLQQQQQHHDIQKHTNESNGRSATTTTAATTTFQDVAGVDIAKVELLEVVECLRSPQRYRSIGARPPKGVLLYGPSGTGKTLLARAVAGEANCSCFLSCSASDFVEMLVGRGAARVRALFDKAKTEALRNHRLRQVAAARRSNTFLQLYHNRVTTTTTTSTRNSSDTDDTPPPPPPPNSSLVVLPNPSAIIFIDEIDALAKSRTGGLHGNDEREQTLNQLLTEMDGFEQPQQLSASEVTVIVLAATNRPEILDSALLRPGRFDRHVYVGYPDVTGREDILRLHTKAVKLDLYSVDLQRLAASSTTHGFTGADLRNVVNEAAFLALRDGHDSVGQKHFIQAIQKVGTMKRT